MSTYALRYTLWLWYQRRLRDALSYRLDTVYHAGSITAYLVCWHKARSVSYLHRRHYREGTPDQATFWRNVRRSLYDVDILVGVPEQATSLLADSSSMAFPTRRKAHITPYAAANLALSIPFISC